MTHFNFKGHKEEKETDITVNAALEIRQEIWQRSDLLAAKKSTGGSPYLAYRLDFVPQY